jgi:metal-responsive CopG/Arc/MetJ family transcriptional regulator
MAYVGISKGDAMPDARDIPRVIIPIPRDLLHRVDEHRFTHRIASRAEAIRQLLEAALAVKTKEMSR